MNIEDYISATTGEIKAMISDLQTATHAFSRKTIELERYYQLQDLTISEAPPQYWRFVGVHDAISKFLEFSESDITKSDDMDLAQKARYFCDAIMWVKHLCDPRKNALEYYEHLLRGKRFHYKKVVEYLQHEIRQLKKIQPMFDLAAFKSTVRQVRLQRGRFTSSDIEQQVSDFDKLINGRFSIYRQRSSGSYQVYAEQLETGLLSEYSEERKKVESEILKLETILNREIAKDHNSKKFAESVSMIEEYEFVFRLTSQHLHATPVSMSTEMRNISKEERLIFLEYIRAKMYEALRVSLHLMSGFPKGQFASKILGKYFSATRRQRPLRAAKIGLTRNSGSND